MTKCLLTILLTLLFAAVVRADDVTDALNKALKLHQAKKDVEAKAEIEKALAAITPIARGQTPAPAVKDRTYTNYEYSFRVTKPEKSWEFSLSKSTDMSTTGTVAFCNLSHLKDGESDDDAIIFYARDLKIMLGPGFAKLKGKEMEFLRGAGQKMASSIAQLADPKITGQTELTVDGCPACRTDYVCHKGDKPMKCFTVDVMRGQMLFTAMFVGSAADEKAIAADFKAILDSIDVSPIASSALNPPPK